MITILAMLIGIVIGAVITTLVYKLTEDKSNAYKTLYNAQKVIYDMKCKKYDIQIESYQKALCELIKTKSDDK